MRRFIMNLSICLLSLATLGGPGYSAGNGHDSTDASTNKTSFRFPEAGHRSAKLTYQNGVPILVVEGTPDEIGTAIGKLALKPGIRVLDYPKELLKSTRLRIRDVQPSCLALYKNVPDPYRAEAEAMIRASKAPRESFIIGNVIFDVAKMFNLKKKPLGCSALLVEGKHSSTGNVLFGRNLDIPSLGFLHELSLVTIYKSKDKHHFVTIGFPGLIGCLSGMNDAGLCVAVHENYNARSGDDKFNAKGIPFAICYRKLLEECASIDEAARLLKRLPRTTQTNLSVADANGVAVFEVTPKSVKVRRAEKGVCVCTNHFCTVLARKQQDRVSASSLCRFKKLQQARHATKLDVRGMHKYLMDVAANSKRSQTIQTMIFEPKALKIHLVFGPPPASQRGLKTLEFDHLLKGKN